MRLIQASANKTDAKICQADGEQDEARALCNPAMAFQDLAAIAVPLLDTARFSASYFVNFIVQRAVKSTKDSPHRNKVDLFVQDFIACMGSSDWPAAELLLRMFVISMISLAKDKKTPGVAKIMPLEVLGMVAAAFSQLTSNVKKMAASIAENSDDDASSRLLQLVELVNYNKLSVRDMVAWGGPYHLTLIHLDSRCAIDFTLQSAAAYFTVDWLSQVCQGHPTNRGARTRKAGISSTDDAERQEVVFPQQPSKQQDRSRTAGL